MRCTSQVLAKSTAEIMPLHMRTSRSLSLWQTKEEHRTGKHLEPQRGVGFLSLTGKASDAVRAITSGITSLRSTGATLYEPRHLWYLAMAYAELGQPDDARRCIDDAIDKVERSKGKWCEAEVHRIAGEIALKSPAPDTEKAEKYFDRALAVARQQQAKSWELRAAMRLARLWRDQGKVS